MAKLIKRIGTKAFKFDVDVLIQKVTLSIAFPCQISIIWRRGPHKSETPKYDLDLVRGQANINEQLNLKATLYQETKTLKYLEKKSSFTVVINTPKGNKIAGMCDIDLATYLNNGIKEKNEAMILQKCPDKNAKLHFYLKITLLSEVSEAESMMTDQSRMNDSFDDVDTMSNFNSTRPESPSAQQFVSTTANNNSNSNNILGDTNLDMITSTTSKTNNNGTTASSKNVLNALNNIAKREQLEEVVKESKLKSNQLDEYTPSSSSSLNKPRNNNFDKSPTRVEDYEKIGSKSTNPYQTAPTSQQQQQQLLQPPSQGLNSSENNNYSLSPMSNTRNQEAFRSSNTTPQKDQNSSEQAGGGGGGGGPKKKATFNDLFSGPVGLDKLKNNQKKLEIPSINKPTSSSSRKPDDIIPSKPINESRGISQDSSGRGGGGSGSGTIIDKNKEISPPEYASSTSSSNKPEIKGISSSIESGTNQISVEKKVFQYGNTNKNVGSVSSNEDSVLVAELKDELSKKDGEINALKANLKSLQRENFELQNAKGNGTSSEEVSSLRMKLNEKFNEVNMLNDEIETLRKEMDNQKQTIYKINKEKGQEMSGYRAEIDKLKQAIKDNELHHQKIQDDMTQLQSKYRRLDSDYKSLNMDYQTLKAENENTLEMYNNLVNERDEAMTSNQTIDLEIKKYKEKNQNLEKEIERLRSDLRNVENDNDRMKKAGQELNRAYENLKKEYTHSKQEWEEKYSFNDKSLRDSLVRAENQLVDLRKQLKEAEAKKEEALSKQTQIAVDLQNLKLSYEKVSMELRSQGDSVESKARNYQETIQELEKENAGLKHKMSMMMSAMKENESRYMDAMNKFKQELNLSRDKNEVLQEQVDKLRETVKQKQQEIESKLANANNSVNDNVLIEKKQLENQVKMMQKNIEFNNIKIKELDENINQLTEENEAMRRELEENEAKRKELENKLNEGKDKRGVEKDMEDKLRQMQAAAQMEIKRLQDEIERLKKESNVAGKSQKTNQDKERELAQMSIENEKLIKEVKELKERLSKASANTQLAKENEDLKIKLKESNKLIKSLEEQITELKVNFANAGNEKDNNIKNLEKIKSQVQSLEKELELVQNELIKSKLQIGSIMNVINEECSSSVLQKIHAAMGIVEH